MGSPSLHDLVTILYRPRETMRRILDSGRARWAPQIVALSFICTQFADLDIRELDRVLPGLSLSATLAFVALCLLAIAGLWVLVVYALAWVVAFIGRFLEGQGTVADVRAALAWGLVPQIWSVIFRVPLAIYGYSLHLHGTNRTQLLAEFVEKGGCTFAVVILAFQLVFDLWVVFVASGTVAEALKVPTWKGFATLAITVGIPIVIIVAARLAFRS